ncbi:MAG: phosphoheptose isomerase [Eubacteriales bacterium]
MNTILDTLMTRYPLLEPIRADIEGHAILEDTYLNGGKVLCCGNGGSASDAGHIVGELMKSFVFKRPIRKDTAEALSAYGEYGAHLSASLEGALPAISLNTHDALSSAFINDTDSSSVYAQLLYGLGRAGDTLIVLTTSGNSRNCVLAAVAAKATGIR